MATNKGLVIDFTNVEEGGFSCPNGDYIVKVKKIEQKTSQNSGAPYFNWELAIIQGPQKGKKLFHITSLKAEALFNLRNTLIACGVEVPKGKLSIDLKGLLNKVLGVTVVNEKYEGKDRPKIKETWPVIKEGAGYSKASEATIDNDDDDEVLDDDDEE